MFKLTQKILTIVGLIAVVALAGCAGSGSDIETTDVTELRSKLEEKEGQLKKLRSEVEDQAKQVRRLEDQITTEKQAREQAYAEMERLRSADGSKSGSEKLLPPADPGECYTRVFVPAEYKQVTEQVLVREASEVLETTPAKYEWVEEKVMVKEASKRLEEVSAEYDWVEEKVLVKEAHTVWKKGRGPVEKVDNTTGEIMCLVDVPAQYQTVRKKVMTKAPSTREVAIPAEYQTVKVRKMVTPPQEKRSTIPAEYDEVTRYVMVSDGYMDWKQVLCETNMSREVVQKIQRALKDKGHDPGPVDGVIGWRTNAAIKAYQKGSGLSVGGLTYETIKHLGVSFSS